jgi:hypothetical protein
MDCRCDTTTELYGQEAAAYLADHVRRAPDGTYSCPDTGKRWRVDEETDPQQPRLVQLPG